MQEARAFFGEDAAFDFRLMVVALADEDIEHAPRRACFEVVGGVHHSLDAGVDHGAGAHAAGFEGDVQGGIWKAVVPGPAGGGAQGDDFGVGGGVAVEDAAVVTAPDHLAAGHQYRADGDFTGFFGFGGQFQGLAHELFVWMLIGHWGGRILLLYGGGNGSWPDGTLAPGVVESKNTG